MIPVQIGSGGFSLWHPGYYILQKEHNARLDRCNASDYCIHMNICYNFADCRDLVQWYRAGSSG